MSHQSRAGAEGSPSPPPASGTALATGGAAGKPAGVRLGLMPEGDQLSEGSPDLAIIIFVPQDSSPPLGVLANHPLPPSKYKDNNSPISLITFLALTTSKTLDVIFEGTSEFPYRCPNICFVSLPNECPGVTPGTRSQSAPIHWLL